ncbi:uncharacterized protein LOC124445889 isoform X2 [Xenia sp. Carnegie-2017]|uniref:uncharacterized protein LOC124445889 isoform X2 n=1 Tax=Xenia sp. Carnegie-2017 TaxID=2897299 RepID=UPI001F04C353|nr:uncharacterized protein LOC124445889 isoform X2 [Xenia sp. Carnegie-2017]
MAFAFHMEALRKQRVLDRKNHALDKILLEQNEMTRRNEEKLRIQCQRKLENEKDNAQAQKQRAINQNDLRHQARVLRNSCLYMGPVNEYFWA